MAPLIPGFVVLNFVDNYLNLLQWYQQFGVWCTEGWSFNAVVALITNWILPHFEELAFLNKLPVENKSELSSLLNCDMVLGY